MFTPLFASLVRPICSGPCSLQLFGPLFASLVPALVRSLVRCPCSGLLEQGLKKGVLVDVSTCSGVVRFLRHLRFSTCTLSTAQSRVKQRLEATARHPGQGGPREEVPPWRRSVIRTRSSCVCGSFCVRRLGPRHTYTIQFQRTARHPGHKDRAG